MRIFSEQERSVGEIPHAAVAIAVVREGQQHLGILHKQESLDEVKLAHLAWHNRLKESEPNDCYLWVELPIPAKRARQVAARCREVLRANERGGIPYAFSAPNDCFDEETGRFLLGPSHAGLTCATFVLAIFDYARVPLCIYGSWPNRSGDAEWQRSIIEQLKQDDASPEHIAAIEKEVGALRYRPEDVAGCAASDAIPCSFEIAEPLSRAILEKLSIHANPLRDD